MIMSMVIFDSVYPESTTLPWLNISWKYYRTVTQCILKVLLHLDSVYPKSTTAPDSMKSARATTKFYLKVPKCEIFHLFDFNDFYGIKSV